MIGVVQELVEKMRYLVRFLDGGGEGDVFNVYRHFGCQE